MGLAHVSKGVGDERRIVVSRPSPVAMETESPYQQAKQTEHNQELTTGQQSSSVDIDTEGGPGNKKKKKKKKKGVADKENIDGIGDVPVDDDGAGSGDDNNDQIKTKNTEKLVREVGVSDGKVVCSICRKDVIKANLMMHELHCARQQKGASGTNAASGCQKPSRGSEASKSSSHRQFDKELASQIKKVDGDDIDSLIATVQHLDASCCFKKCKTSVATLYQECSLCSGRYCLSHHIPEVHGCGEAARAAARARISKEGVLHRGSGVPDRTMDPGKKAHLQRKMDVKLTEMSAKRKGKPKK